MSVDLHAIRQHYERAQQLLSRSGDHPAARMRAAVASADDVPVLLAEVERLRLSVPVQGVRCPDCTPKIVARDMTGAFGITGEEKE